MKFTKRVEKTTQYLLVKLRDRNLSSFLINTAISVSLFLYISLRYEYINSQVPFWFTRTWGDLQLTSKFTLYIIPLASMAIGLVALGFVLLNKYYLRFLEDIVWYCVLFGNVFLFASVVRIIRVASVPFKPLINPTYMNLVPSFVFAFLLMRILMPYFLDIAKKYKLITIPKVHDHPGMILQSPSARGGGFMYALIFLFAALIFVGISKNLVGMYLSVIMTAVLGIVDDYQNTHPKSGYRLMENPVLRLFLLFISVFPVILSGVIIYTVSDLSGGVINLDVLNISIGKNIVSVVPVVLTALWVVWLMNVLSWSNGVDGQFPGIVGISSVLISLLALRFEETSSFHTQIAILSSISAGAAFGSVKYNWHPSKIMWGFGAMSAGLIIASLAISAQAKITVSVLILLVPFIDAVFTVGRRILKGKSPFKGDRGHLHHVLLDRGWGVNKVALFYWLATAVFGLIGLLSPERIVIRLTLIIMGLVAFFIIILNVSINSRKNKNAPTV